MKPLLFSLILCFLFTPCLDALPQGNIQGNTQVKPENLKKKESLLKLPEAQEDVESKKQKKDALLVIPEVEGVEKEEAKDIKEKPTKQEILKASDKKTDINSAQNEEQKPSKKELPENTSYTTTEKTLLLKAQKPLPKFYSVKSNFGYRDTILKAIDALAQVEVDILAFDTNNGFILFDTDQNRYLITIFEFNHYQWLKVLPLKNTLEEDKELNKFFSYMD